MSPARVEIHQVDCLHWLESGVALLSLVLALALNLALRCKQARRLIERLLQSRHQFVYLRFADDQRGTHRQHVADCPHDQSMLMSNAIGARSYFERRRKWLF